MTTASANEARRIAARERRRRILLFALVLAAVLLTADWFTHGVTHGWVFGRAELTVTTEPAGAAVTVDGEPRGFAPLTLVVEPGDLTLLVRHPHHPAHLERLRLARGEQLHRDLVLDPAWGTLVVASNPRGARVSLDGALVPGVTPLTLDRVQAGRRTIALQLRGRTAKQLEVEILPDTATDVTVELERARTGSLTVRPVPGDAAVVLQDGFGERYAPGEPVPIGRYTLSVTRSGYLPYEAELEIGTVPRSVDVALERASGTLRLTVQPPDAHITVTGQGSKPVPYRADMALAVGSAAVEARAPGHRTERRVLRIRDGVNSATLELRPIRLRPGQRLQDPLPGGAGAPPMIVVPAGRLPAREPAADTRALPGAEFDTPFAIGIHEVTRGEWALYAAAAGRPMPPAGEATSDRHPVTGIGFDEAADYADWLSSQTGERYRIPSEAEWEYAARAGQSGLWPEQGDSTDLCTWGNVADATLATRFRSWETLDCNDGYARTAPVGQFRANAWGVHDMLGNVAEWTATCWESTPGSADAASTDCGSRVVRGGSWDTAAGGANLAAAEPAGRAGDDRGFRLLREL